MKRRKKPLKKLYVLTVTDNNFDVDSDRRIENYYFISKHARYRFFDHEFTQDSELSIELEDEGELVIDDGVVLSLSTEVVYTERDVRRIFNI